MSKHIVDHNHSADASSSRAEQYVRIERETIPSDATKKAQREDRSRGANGRLKAFTRIEREQD